MGKGFGAVMLQYAVHFLIIKFSSKLISQVAQLFSDNPNFLASDPRLASVADHPMSAPASHDGSVTDLRSSPRMTKSSLTDSPSARRRQQAGSGMPDLAPRSFSRETRENTLLSSGHEYSLGGPSKRSLNEVKESSESEMDSRFEPLFNPRPPGSSGLPSLLSFSTTSPTRRTLHDDEM